MFLSFSQLGGAFGCDTYMDVTDCHTEELMEPLNLSSGLANVVEDVQLPLDLSVNKIALNSHVLGGQDPAFFSYANNKFDVTSSKIVQCPSNIVSTTHDSNNFNNVLLNDTLNQDTISDNVLTDFILNNIPDSCSLSDLDNLTTELPVFSNLSIISSETGSVGHSSAVSEPGNSETVSRYTPDHSMLNSMNTPQKLKLASRKRWQNTAKAPVATVRGQGKPKITPKYLSKEYYDVTQATYEALSGFGNDALSVQKPLTPRVVNKVSNYNECTSTNQGKIIRKNISTRSLGDGLKPLSKGQEFHTDIYFDMDDFKIVKPRCRKVVDNSPAVKPCNDLKTDLITTVNRNLCDVPVLSKFKRKLINRHETDMVTRDIELKGVKRDTVVTDVTDSRSLQDPHMVKTGHVQKPIRKLRCPSDQYPASSCRFVEVKDHYHGRLTLSPLFYIYDGLATDSLKVVSSKVKKSVPSLRVTTLKKTSKMICERYVQLNVLKNL